MEGEADDFIIDPEGQLVMILDETPEDQNEGAIRMLEGVVIKGSFQQGPPSPELIASLRNAMRSLMVDAMRRH